MRIRDLFSKISRLIQYYETKKTTGAAAPASLAPMSISKGTKRTIDEKNCFVYFFMNTDKSTL